jgi:Cu(I)/Ag(I) efflux system membrane protein CusA/SilA
VASVGGFVRQYQVQVDPERLRAYRMPLRDVVAAVRSANYESGGGVLEIAGHEQVIRGRGYVSSLADLEQVPLRAERMARRSTCATWRRSPSARPATRPRRARR